MPSQSQQLTIEAHHLENLEEHIKKGQICGMRALEEREDIRDKINTILDNLSVTNRQ